MGFLIGKGRYGRLTYPVPAHAAASSGGALVKAAFDQPPETVSYPGAAPAFTATLDRTLAGAPLMVQLPNVTPGNILVVDFSGIDGRIVEIGDSAQAFLPVVSFNGVTLYGPGTGWFQISNALSFGTRGGLGAVVPGTIRCYAAVVIPAGATTASVQIAYTATAGFFMAGLNLFAVGVPSCTLSAMELLAVNVQQPGPSVLVAY